MKLSIEQLLPGGRDLLLEDEADVQRILAFEHTMIGSDGLPTTRRHTRACGARFRACSATTRAASASSRWRPQVHKMTGLTARTFGLKDRGVLKSGMAADIAIFDAGEIDEAATFAKPIQPARGIDSVIVNGAVAGARESRPGRARAGC